LVSGAFRTLASSFSSHRRAAGFSLAAGRGEAGVRGDASEDSARTSGATCKGGPGAFPGISEAGASVSSTNTGEGDCIDGNMGDMANPRSNTEAWAAMDRTIILRTIRAW
jgi:hypothetical protein